MPQNCEDRATPRATRFILTLFAASMLILPLGAGPALAQPTVISVWPTPQMTHAHEAWDIVIQFAGPLDPGTVDSSSFHAFGRWSGPATGTFVFELADTRIRFRPDQPFFRGEWVTVSLTRDIRDAGGQPLTSGYVWNYWTRTDPGTLDLVEIDRIDIREEGEGLIQTYGAYAGDLNNDGSSDLAVVNEITSDVRVFLNDGVGNYGSFTTYPMIAGTFASPNAGTDLNADGEIDLVVAHQDLTSATVFWGDGSGGFPSSTTIQAGQFIRGLDVLDLDADGLADILTANTGLDALATVHNNGDGSFDPPVTVPTVANGERACAVADANHDGIADVFVGARGSEEIVLMLGDGSGGLVFSARTAVTSGPWMMAVGDVNGDGHVDVVSANASNTIAENNVAVVFGDGEGGLSDAMEYYAGLFPLAIDLGDLDGDRDLDMVSSNWFDADWNIFENDGQGNFTWYSSPPAGTHASCAILHDRDGDGDLDMTGTDEGDDILVILDNPRIPVAAPPARPNHSSRLIGAAPNPFNPRTLIRYELAIAGAVEISVVDARGRVVRHLWVGTRDAGPGQVTWDGTDEAGTSVASATYFVVLRTADAMDTASIVLLK